METPERSAAEVLYPSQNHDRPAAQPGAAERTVAEVLYGKEPAKEPAKEAPKAEQPKSDKADGKNYLTKLAEDAAAADRYDLKLPDGVLVDEPLMRDFNKLAREHGFNNDQAQRWADLHLRAIGDVHRQVAEYEQVSEDRYTEVKGWETEFQNDPEFGGANAKETIAQARQALESFGTPEEVARLTKELERTGLGNHPILIKGLAKLAQYL